MSRLLSDDPALPGLLWAMRFDGAGTGRLLGRDEDVPALGSFGDGFLWLHLNLVDARIEALIEEGRFGPRRLALSAFSPDRHQRIAVEGAHVGGVVADLVRNGDGPGTDAAGRLHFVMGPRFLVSGRRQPVASPEVARAAAAQGECIAAPILLLETLVEHVVGAMTAAGARLSDELDAIEDHILEERVRGDRRRLGPIRRDAVRLHRQLLGLRAVFRRLEEDGATHGLPPAETATAARIAQRLDALDRDMVVLADRSRLMQEELSSRLAEQSNRQLYTLSVLTALFLPPTLVTGVFGMNTKGLPLSESDGGSWLALVVALTSALAAFLVIRFLGIRPPRD
ncbi:transporter [uncultured Methylobacterium sp.]|jgi:zinc transporter|uniref:transporter n=1 Tax=uncultured Methylobacterium sp. TaxID=157278 RepID=UPI00262E5BD3|nr:transporter [uncultured Methylobacterium sp.]